MCLCSFPYCAAYVFTNNVQTKPDPGLKCKGTIILFVFVLFLSNCSNQSGTKLPDFNTLTMQGKEISTSQLSGKITVIKIWATWCGSCREEIPELNQLVETYQSDSNVVFIAITDDPRETIEKFIQKRPFKYEQICDAGELKNKLQKGIYQEIPEHIIVDQHLNIVLDLSGETPGIGKILAQKIEQLKQQKKID